MTEPHTAPAGLAGPEEARTFLARNPDIEALQLVITATLRVFVTMPPLGTKSSQRFCSSRGTVLNCPICPATRCVKVGS